MWQAPCGDGEGQVEDASVCPIWPHRFPFWRERFWPRPTFSNRVSESIAKFDESNKLVLVSRLNLLEVIEDQTAGPLATSSQRATAQP